MSIKKFEPALRYGLPNSTALQNNLNRIKVQALKEGTMIKSKRDLIKLNTWGIDIVQYQFRNCINIHPDLFKTYLMGASTFAVQFLTKNYSRLKQTGKVDFDNLAIFNFFEYELVLNSLKNQYITDAENKIKERSLTDVELFFSYISPSFFRMLVEGIFERKAKGQLEEIADVIQSPIQEWYQRVSRILATYKISIPKQWLDKHPLNEAEMEAVLLRYNYYTNEKRTNNENSKKLVNR